MSTELELNEVEQKEINNAAKDFDKRIAAEKKSKELQKKKDAKKDFKKEAETKNLSKFADRMKNFSVNENNAGSGQRALLYFYPENWNSMNISGKEGKQFRTKLRNSLIKNFNLIFVKERTGQTAERNAAIKEFLQFYKKNYRINDFSLGSLSHVTDEAKKSFYTLCFDIIKDSKIKL